MNQEKDDGFWLLWGIFNEYIKQNIILAESQNEEGRLEKGIHAFWNWC